MSEGIMKVIAGLLVLLIFVVITVLIVKSVRGVRKLLIKHTENKYKHTYMSTLVTLLLQAVIMTTYANIVVTSSIRWYGTPATNFVSLLNLILIIPVNALVAYGCGYKTKKDIITASLLGVILTMLFIIIVGKTGVGVLLGI